MIHCKKSFFFQDQALVKELVFKSNWLLCMKRLNQFLPERLDLLDLTISSQVKLTGVPVLISVASSPPACHTKHSLLRRSEWYM